MEVLAVGVTIGRYVNAPPDSPTLAPAGLWPYLAQRGVPVGVLSSAAERNTHERLAQAGGR